MPGCGRPRRLGEFVSDVQEQVVLVDEQDNTLRVMEKIAAHAEGVLHRAFSVFVVRERAGETELLLQLRATGKYHFGGLWTNTCCGHPRLGETPVEAGQRRLPQEMNFGCALRAIGSFIYRARSSNGLIEHELDHVLLGGFDGEPPAPNPAEADTARFIAFAALDRELVEQPDRFTPWFAQGYALVKAELAKNELAKK
jgi:isopentenyl-diphosphate delta-isomerase